MAIIIPSKHIYSKSFDPVIDNNITQIEVSKKECNIVTDYRTIVNNENRNAQNILKSEIVTDTDCQFSFITGDNYYIAVQYASLQLGYLTNVTIEIPKEIENKRITSIYDKKTIDGYNNIGYTVNYIAKSYNISANATLKIKQSDKSVSIQSLTLGNRSNEVDTNTSGTVSDDNPVEYKESATVKYSSQKQLTLETTCSISNESTIPIASVVDNGDSYSITLKILTYKNQYYLRYGSPYNNIDWANDQTLSVTMNGRGIEFVPNTVDITIYGDVIELDIMEIVEKIGNGNNVFSFDGNELIQTTNTPSNENKYQAIVNAWKTGKQTAVISCPITDYYDEEGNLSVGGNTLLLKYTRPIEILYDGDVGGVPAEYGGEQYMLTTGGVSVGDKIYYNQDKNDYATVLQYVEPYKFVVKFNNYNGEFWKDFHNATVNYIKANANAPLNPIMLFQIGDIVIPYTYTNKGDKPLAYNKDFTPKQFKVVGTKISKRQGGTQELTLQEI